MHAILVVFEFVRKYFSSYVKRIAGKVGRNSQRACKHINSASIFKWVLAWNFLTHFMQKCKDSKMQALELFGVQPRVESSHVEKVVLCKQKISLNRCTSLVLLCFLLCPSLTSHHLLLHNFERCVTVNICLP